MIFVLIVVHYKDIENCQCYVLVVANCMESHHLYLSFSLQHVVRYPPETASGTSSPLAIGSTQTVHEQIEPQMQAFGSLLVRIEISDSIIGL